MIKNHQLQIGAVLSYISIVVNILTGLLYTPWMIRQIGQSQYGLYTLAISLISLFLLDFGLSSAAARYVSHYHATGEEEKVNGFLGAIYKLYLIVDVLIFVALIVIYFLIDIIYAKLTPTEIAQFKVVYAIAGIYSIVNFPFVTFDGILTAYEKFAQLKLADVIYRVLVVGLMVIALWCGWGLYALVTVNAVAGLLILLYKYIVIQKTTPVKVNFHYSDRLLYKEIFSYSIWITVASLAQRLVFNVTPSILAIVANSATIAVFGVIAIIEGYTYTITTAINGMFMPKISRIYAGNDAENDLMPLMLRIGKFQYALNGLIVIGFAGIGRQFIHLWMGDTYQDAYIGIMLVIIPGMFFNALQIAHTAIMVQNKVRLTAFTNLFMGIVNIVLSVALSHFYGVIGACVAIFISYMLRAIFLNVIYHKVLQVDMFRFSRECYLRLLPPMLLTSAGSFGMNLLISDGSWICLVLKGVIIVAMYAVFLFCFGLSNGEKKKLFSLIQR